MSTRTCPHHTRALSRIGHASGACRRRVYNVLHEHGIETPRHAVLVREEGREQAVAGSKDQCFSGMTHCLRAIQKPSVVEMEDIVDIDGVVFRKPFVEKPVSAEDHNVHVYFPLDCGGGSQRLFRKVEDRCSEYSQHSSVRSSGSYIYEEFMATDGSDVKVYAVGLDYAHAEARKSPALDGRVERDDLGKEKRYPVLLTAAEKLIARKVVLAFKQTVCAFDILRSNGKSYVCDVNGFSFVKNSQKYYDDCAQILLELITMKLAPEYLPATPLPIDDIYLTKAATPPVERSGSGALGRRYELRSVIGIIRHGDRTPKQKMKMVVTHKRFVKLYEELSVSKTGRVKIKDPKLMQRVLDIARGLLEEATKKGKCQSVEEKVHKLEQLKAVLEMHGHFSGINRKVQFKQLNGKHTPSQSTHGRPSDKGAQATQLLLILKWGGELTSVGQRQAEELGRAFRCMYPGGEGEYASLPGSGFLRLHSTYRHDLKVYASDEGRVQMTAAAFTKGLLELEGNLASVLVHLVKRDAVATAMLDVSCANVEEVLAEVKERLHTTLKSSEDITDSTIAKLVPTGISSQEKAIRLVKNFKGACCTLWEKITQLMTNLRQMLPLKRDVVLYHEETLMMMYNRWDKLEKDFRSHDGEFDISKIPDIYDSAKYDLLHNRHVCLSIVAAIYTCAMHLADIVVPQEYGITVEEKLKIATQVCRPLLKKICSDLHHTLNDEVSDIIHRLDPMSSEGVISPERHIRTRLYFTSESHVHTMVNILKYGGLFELTGNDQWKSSLEKINSIPELNYMTQILFQLFEDPHQSPDSPLRYLINVHFSPGVRGREDLIGTGEESCHNGHRDAPPSDVSSSLKPQQYDPRRASSSAPGLESMPVLVGVVPLMHVCSLPFERLDTFFTRLSQ
ncbi:hypothetical protein EMCRGX_G011780 [Ephydatia muelleri]